MTSLFSLLIALLFAPGQQSIPNAGVYDIYVHGIKKGISHYREDTQGNLSLEGANGLGASTKGTFHYEGDRLRHVEFEVTGVGATKMEYEVDGDSLTRKSAGGEKRGGMPKGGSFYYPFHPALLKSLLDRITGSNQSFQPLPAIDLIKGEPRTITAERYRTETRTIAGKSVRVRIWRLDASPSPDAVLFTDESNHVLNWWVPAAGIEMTLRGFEDLRPSHRYENSVSAPTYRVKVESDVWMPMRDGVRLMADVYRPDADGRFPVLLQRTPYDRSEFGNADGEFFAQRGYVYVTQHARGRGGSEGPFEYCRHEDVDGYDSVQWCGTQPWSNGKVGMLGASYNAYSEWMAAKLQPPWLKTMISQVPMPGAPDGAPWDRGTTFFSNMLAWFGILRDKAKVQPFNADMTVATNTLPVSQADNVLFGKNIDAYDFFIDKPTMDEDVKRSAYRFDLDKIDMPVLHLSGWFDSVGVGTKLNYTEMVAKGRKNQKLIWGPWDHLMDRDSRYGDVDYGPDAYIDLHLLYLRWFDRWLKGMKNGIDKEPPVETFMLGENRWYRGAAWPAKEVTYQKWYLHSAESVGGGKQTLAPTAPQAELPNRYVYDPAAYVFGPDLQASFFGNIGFDSRALCERKDQLVYDSEVLKSPLRLCGPVTAKLYAATSAVDTDWVLALLDVYPDGKAIPLCAGIVRAQFRDSYEKPTLLEPHKVYAYDIDMWQTGIAIPAGHRVRVVVLSTLFPDKDRNLNLGEPAGSAVRMVTAEQTIYHDTERPSYVVLPVLKRG